MLLSLTLGFSDQKISDRLETSLRTMSHGDNIHAWIYFTDKHLTDPAKALREAELTLDNRALWRRSKVRNGALIDLRDVPVAQEYVDAVLSVGAESRTTSRWLNAMSISATEDQLEMIRELPFVERIDLVLSGKRRESDVSETIPTADPPHRTTRLEYGPSFDQLDQINVVAVHDSGYSGQGVRVLMLDTGFFTSHEAIPDSQIIAEWDFINSDSVTSNELGDPDGQHDHGTYTLTTLGGKMSGQLYGPAYNAQFILAKTEDLVQEQPIEEDWYVAGLEWGESLGADIASSSLGYIDWYLPSDLDGLTAVTTVAVNTAIENGMVITTAAGNGGDSGIIAPADAFDVITCGAVDSSGAITWFSSWGPTADGRIKPEVCARGLYTYCASPNGNSTNTYVEVSGTSLSTPLIGGACALILEAHPDWTPRMVRESLMMTASQTDTPDNQYGWGLIDVLAAINYGFSTGDMNGDGSVNVTDVVLLVNFILGNQTPTPEEMAHGDMNDDLLLNVLDVVAVVGIILG